MKQVLLMMPSYYGFDEVIHNVLAKHSGHQVKTIDTSPKIAYRNFADKAMNFASKIFFQKNLKPEMRRKRIMEAIDDLQEIDFLIINRVDLIDEEVFNNVIKKSKKKILLLWDSLKKIEMPINRFSSFDIIYSFDTNDCRKYNFQKIENFHFGEAKPTINPLYDAVYLGTLDAREQDLLKILQYLKNTSKKAKAFLLSNGKRSIVKSNEIEMFKKAIPFNESVFIAKQGMVVIDLSHINQNGLSFRVFEAMLLKKKLITTNKQIVNYDFYNPNNIFVLDNIDDIEIPDLFWVTPYQELDKDILFKYGAENWVKKILQYAR